MRILVAEDEKSLNRIIAKQKSLDSAGVKAKDAVLLKAYYDYDDLVAHYEIKFEANGYEYEYEIKAATVQLLTKTLKEKETPLKQIPQQAIIFPQIKQNP